MNGALPPNPWRWSGSYLDAAGLYKMGARYYDPSQGRFTQIDPVAGGSCNYYDYACGDPINNSDVNGTKSKPRELTPEEKSTLARLTADCSGPDRYGADISGSGSCQRFRSAVSNGDLSEFGIGFTPRPAGDCPSWMKTTARFVGAGDAFRAANDIAEGRNPIGNSWSATQSYALTKEAVRNATAAAKLGASAGTAGFTALDAVCTLH